MHREPLRHRWRVIAPTVGLLFALSLPGAALAHAELVTATPHDGEVVTAQISDILLTFDEPLQDGSGFDLLDGSGAVLASGAPVAEAPTVMRATVPALQDGSYRVQWTSVAADGDVERDSFSFSVALATAVPATPSAASSDGAGDPTPSPTPAATPAATPDPGSAGGGGLDVVLPIALVALVLGIGLAMLLRRRPA